MKQFLASALVAVIAYATEANLETEFNEDKYLSSFGAYVPQKNEETIPYSEAGPKKATGKAQRGHIRQPRRRDAKQPPLDPHGVEGITDLRPNAHNGRFYDWRDYEPDLHGGVDPYAHCVNPKDTQNLDTPEY